MSCVIIQGREHLELQCKPSVTLTNTVRRSVAAQGTTCEVLILYPDV